MTCELHLPSGYLWWSLVFNRPCSVLLSSSLCLVIQDFFVSSGSLPYTLSLIIQMDKLSAVIGECAHVMSAHQEPLWNGLANAVCQELLPSLMVRPDTSFRPSHLALVQFCVILVMHGSISASSLAHHSVCWLLGVLSRAREVRSETVSNLHCFSGLPSVRRPCSRIAVR